MHKKSIKPIFFLIILFGLFLVPCLAQEKKESITIYQEDLPKYKNPISPIYCEVALLYIENAILRARKLPESNLIFILHLGSGESNKLATLRRKQFRNYLNKSEISSVVALGENAKGNGSWNIYLEGKLLYSLPLFKNDDFNLVGGCIDG